jgi:hypothetical protein
VSVQVSTPAILLIISSTGSLVNNNREKMNDFKDCGAHYQDKYILDGEVGDQEWMQDKFRNNGTVKISRHHNFIWTYY